MNRKQNLIFFAGGVAFLLFGILMLGISNGSFNVEYVKQTDGSYDMSKMLGLVGSFILCILALAGLITVFQDGTVIEWLQAAGVIVVITIAGTIFSGILNYVGVLVGGIYAIWWSISAIKSLINLWEDGWWANVVLAICRVAVAAALITAVFAFACIDLTPEIPSELSAYTTQNSLISGICAILAGVGMCTEGVLWFKFSDY